MGRRVDSLPRVSWPEGARCAVTLSFDVDAESAALNRGEEYAKRLTSLSQGRYGIHRGLPRILDLLDEHAIQATFFVPGYTAEQHAEAIREIHRSGHEIGHHGYLHERPDRLSPEQELVVIERGIAALDRVVGVRPVGYRSPAWEITPTTLQCLNACGFLYDSSCMGSDIPYVERHGDHQMLELPVQWLLDDWPLFGFDGDNGGQISNPDKVFEIWAAEFDGLYKEGGYFMLTMHPEVSGRPHRVALLDRLIRHIRDHVGVWWATAEQVARHSAPQLA
ncbi:MAG: putative hydrolase [Chloroflexi bacterium]|nr:putative hydrolase [Chloroflexota bacterium]